MRIDRLFAIVLAVIVSLPVYSAPVPAQARSLLEALFPRAAERRERRREYRRQRRLEDLRRQQRYERRWRRQQDQRVLQRGDGGKLRKRTRKRSAAPVKKVSGPQYYTYKPDRLSQVRLGTVLNAVKKRQQKAAAERAARLAQETPEGRKALRDAMAALPSRGITFAAAAPLLTSIELTAEPGAAKALANHYAATPEFLWVDASGQPNDRALAVIEVLSDAESFGLRSADYEISSRTAEEAGLSESAGLRNALSFELALSAKALRYAKDAQHGRVDPNRISGYHDFAKNKPNYPALMASLAKAADPAQFLLDAHPRERAFALLRKELASLRTRRNDADLVTIPEGTFIRPGMEHPELGNVIGGIRKKGSPELLEQHIDTLASYTNGNVYGKKLVALVKGFQKENKLGPDGIIGRNTLAKLVDETPETKIQKVLMAMERLRWHPSKFGSTHVFINQPAFRASYIQDGKTQLSMRSIVGKRSNQTSFFHDEIEYVEYNPYWGVPRSIIVNEMLPKLRRDPSWLDRNGYEVTNSRRRQVSSSSIDWWSVGSTPPYDIRQRPGPKNALGELKIMFPNKHAIYMHDTPSRNLFSRSQRALSHGCVRLARPHDMAAAVLGSSVNAVKARVAQGQNATQKLARKIPVYVAYFTAWPDESGEMKYYGDVYGRDEALEKAITATDRARAEGGRA